MDIGHELPSLESYDAVPYDSYPYSQSHPEHLQALGLLFGMKPAPLENAKILELGCASGGNLLPIACTYPKATLVGIDLSRVEIKEANSHKKALKLSNITFKHTSILDIQADFGKFDYIICHGIISWVPEEVRNKIFKICSKNLSKNGIAYISYNTLPGWNMVQTIRDLMLFQADKFSDYKMKVKQAKLFFQLVLDLTKDNQQPYAQFLRQESELLKNHDDYYLLHDHLEETNYPYYFFKFIEQAEKNGLTYLADCSLASMYIHNMPEALTKHLKNASQVTSEQIIDFIRNRRFRETLLCHKRITLNKQVTPEKLLEFNFTSTWIPKPNQTHTTDQKTTFMFKDGIIDISEPVIKNFMLVLAENLYTPLHLNNVIHEIKKKDPTLTSETIKKIITTNIAQLVLKGLVNITARKIPKLTISDKPKVLPLVAHQLSLKQNWVTNIAHKIINLNPATKLILENLNGINNKDALLKIMLDNHANGIIKIQQNNANLEDPNLIQNSLLHIIDQLIKQAYSLGLMEK